MRLLEAVFDKNELKLPCSSQQYSLIKLQKQKKTLIKLLIHAKIRPLICIMGGKACICKEKSIHFYVRGKKIQSICLLS